MFRPHMGHHQANLIIWGGHCTVHFVLSTLRHIVVIVVVVIVIVANFLRKIFLSYIFSGRFTVMYNIYYYDFIFKLSLCI
jgi:hypothetical protein